VIGGRRGRGVSGVRKLRRGRPRRRLGRRPRSKQPYSFKMTMAGRLGGTAAAVAAAAAVRRATAVTVTVVTPSRVVTMVKEVGGMQNREALTNKVEA